MLCLATLGPIPISLLRFQPSHQVGRVQGKLDFFSYHFYENSGMLGAYERRGQGYTNYLLGRYEAVLKSDPNDPTALCQVGYCRFREGSYDLALQYLFLAGSPPES